MISGRLPTAVSGSFKMRLYGTDDALVQLHLDASSQFVWICCLATICYTISARALDGLVVGNLYQSGTGRMLYLHAGWRQWSGYGWCSVQANEHMYMSFSCSLGACCPLNALPLWALRELFCACVVLGMYSHTFWPGWCDELLAASLCICNCFLSCSCDYDVPNERQTVIGKSVRNP